MKYGFVVDVADIHTIGDLTHEAEAAGWDGVFIGDVISLDMGKGKTIPLYDVWITLAVMAMRTERIHIGTTITAMTRRRPWKLAREALTIDHLSKGRLIMGVGLGAANHDTGFSKVGEPTELKTLAQRLDEGLEILTGLWTGKPFSFEGEHYRVEKMSMLPKPVQRPRIPIWVVGVWPKEKSMRRAMKWDGVIPQKYKSMERVTPAEVAAIKQSADEQRGHVGGFDIIVGGETGGSTLKQAVKKVRPFAEAGATWWLESVMTQSADELRKRIKKGPPRLE